MENININHQEKHVTVKWKDGSESSFAYLWLRDHCRCPKCLHEVTLQRLVDVSEIPQDVEPISANVEHNGDLLKISWQDDHVSSFPTSWLREKDLPAINHRNKLGQVMWGSEIANKVPSLSYETVMEGGEKGVKAWLDLIDTYGFALVLNCPPTVEASIKLIERISYIRLTIYGTYWDFTPNMEMKDTAYTTLPLKPHTDGCYFYDPPGMQAFHLLEFNGTGGETILVDGCKLAHDIKTNHPDAFEFFLKTKVPFHYIDDNNYLYHEKTIFEVDPSNGRLIRFSFNNDDRAPLHWDVEKTKLFYKYLHILLSAIKDPSNQHIFQMTPGTFVAIDNWRVMHGRTAFTGHRRLTGCYLHKEDMESRKITSAIKSFQF